MVPCHVQILANFTYHILYKPVFTSHEFSHQPLLPLNQRGYRETETTVIIDQTSMIVILKDVNDYTDRMWFLGSSFFGNYQPEQKWNSKNATVGTVQSINIIVL